MNRSKRALAGKSRDHDNGQLPDRRRQSSRLRASTSSEPDSSDGSKGRSPKNNRYEDTDVDEPVFEVEKVLGKMYDEAGHPSYLIKWKGYDETSWEPSENCECKNLIDGYEQIIKRANRSR